MPEKYKVKITPQAQEHLREITSYSRENFARHSGQKSLEIPLAQSYTPTNLKRETLPVLGR